MHPGGLKFWGALNMWGLLLLVLLPLVVGACASTPSSMSQLQPEKPGEVLMARASNPTPQPAAKPDPLELCTQVDDQELQTMRGCYNEFYYFGYQMDITAGSNPSVLVAYTANVPEGQAPTITGNMMTYRSPDGEVAFQAGMGDPSIQSGFASMVTVAGTGNTVISESNIRIIVPNATTLTPSINIFSAPTLSGIK